MGGKREKPEEIVLKLRQVEVLQGQGKPLADVVDQIDVTVQTYYRWRKEYGGMNRDQLKRLKLLEAENTRLRRAVSDLKLDKMILTEAAGANYYALHVAAGALSTCVRCWASRTAGPAVHWVNTDGHSARYRAVYQTKSV
jgi:putative transposase